MISIKKFFTKDISKADETNIEFSVDTEEVAKVSGAWYDEAVRDVMIGRVKGVVREQLIEMCYSEEEVRDTKSAIAHFGGTELLSKDFVECLNLFPNARSTHHSSHSSYRIIGLSFNLNEFINQLVGDFYEH